MKTAQISEGSSPLGSRYQNLALDLYRINQEIEAKTLLATQIRQQMAEILRESAAQIGIDVLFDLSITPVLKGPRD